MEKRALLAALLSGVVLVAWYAFFTPSAPAPAVSPTRPEARPMSGSEASPTGVAGQGGTVPAETPALAPPAEMRAAVAGVEEERLELRGDRWSGWVSSRGGIVRSLVLDAYKADGGGVLDLAGPEGMLAIAGPGPWNDEVYSVERVANGVRLRWSDGKGNWVEKVLAAGAGRYAIEAEVRAGGEPARLGVAVSGGIGGHEKAFDRGALGVGGAVVRINGSLEHINPAKLEGAQELRGMVEFAGVQDQYFLVALLPDGDLARVRVEAVGTKAGAVARVAAVGEGGVVRGTLFAGPKEHETLIAYGRRLDETTSFGFFGFFSVMFLAALRWIYTWSANWGVAIIVLTAGIRVLLFPLTHKSTVAMKRMQALQPKMKAIQDRYQERAKKDPNVRARMNQEVMQLYKQEGVNPLGGCLPTLVQLPILWALYTLFAYAIELRHAPFALWIHDLSIKDPTYITPILMTASMVLQQRMAPQVGDPTQRKLFMMMPFIFGFMFMSFPSGLVLYWLVNNVLTIGQQVLTDKLLQTKPASAAV
jgi:YidC/Oxa1 family membrane protein insertase